MVASRKEASEGLEGSKLSSFYTCRPSEASCLDQAASPLFYSSRADLALWRSEAGPEAPSKDQSSVEPSALTN